MWDSVSVALGGHSGTVPKVGFSPKMPQKALGTRIDPAPSDPWAIGPIPAATAAAAPPLDPPAARSSRQGLYVDPISRFVVSAFHPTSGTLVLPEHDRARVAQAFDDRGVAISGTKSAFRSEPDVVRTPFVHTRSLIDTGTPSSGGPVSPLR